MVDNSRLKISGYDRFKGGNQTITVALGGKNATFRVTVAPNQFEGTWYGTTSDKHGEEVWTLPRTLTMSEDSWTVKWEKTEHYASDEYSGTYTRDSDSGKHAELLLKKWGFNQSMAPKAIEVLSSTELKLTGGTFGRDGLELTRGRR
jgi:hypothetical protein